MSVTKGTRKESWKCSKHLEQTDTVWHFIAQGGTYPRKLSVVHDYSESVSGTLWVHYDLSLGTKLICTFRPKILFWLLNLFRKPCKLMSVCQSAPDKLEASIKDCKDQKASRSEYTLQFLCRVQACSVLRENCDSSCCPQTAVGISKYICLILFCLKNYQVVYFKYVQFIVQQLYITTCR